MLKRSFKAFLFTQAAILIIMLVSCDPGRKYEKEEASQIKNFLAANSNVTFDLEPSGLYYHEVLAGSGTSPIVGDSVFVRYSGMFVDGIVFDPGPAGGVPYGFVVGNNITGFDEGIMLMKTGGKATFLIPSKLAYGAAGSYGYDPYYGYYTQIPGYAPLVFDVELVRIKPPAGK